MVAPQCYFLFPGFVFVLLLLLFCSLLCSVLYCSLFPKILGINNLTVYFFKRFMPIIWLFVLSYMLLYRVLYMVVAT